MMTDDQVTGQAPREEKRGYSYIGSDPAYIENLYTQYKTNPQSVDEKWQKFFEGYEFSETFHDRSFSPNGHNVDEKEVAVVKLIQGYRARGHLIAETNPVRERRNHKSDLELAYFGLNDTDLDREFEAGQEISLGKKSLREILEHLKKTYCSTIGVEYMYCRNEKLRQWLYNEMEPIGNKPNFSQSKKLHILHKINQAVTFESFVQTKYVGKKRFSLEGLESLIPSLDAAITQAADLGCEDFVLGMSHRGRLNVLVNIMEKSYEDVFSEFEDNVTDNNQNGGDVKYHLGKSADVITHNGDKVHLTLVPNPSHLEAIGPVLLGMAYAKIQNTHKGDTKKVVPILIHGDAAIAGQGVNYELANMSKLDGFQAGGTVHIVLNNQIGFTANYKECRSSVYCTDIAKVTESPVFHVNADDPEAVVHAIQLALRIRQTFHIDVYVDILGYRRYGHNEGDEPRFTQPMLYSQIQGHDNIYNVFLKNLVKNGDISQEKAIQNTTALKQDLQEKLDFTKNNQHKSKPDTLKGRWKGMIIPDQDQFEASIPTGVQAKELDNIIQALTTIPDNMNLFAKMKKILDQRNALYTKTHQVDWALAELLAYGSLLTEGHRVRLTGQDTQRGTFSHRHAVIKDTVTEDMVIPLNHIQDEQKPFEVYNTLLSEYCALGFEYGYSLVSPNPLVIWEAQFGDFANGAQIVIDQFIASAETKWNRISGITLLLPHGYEGQGPEHSSARPERFLQLCAQNNMVVVNITTPANFFHVLRRQVKQPFRKPLIVMSPKSLLRHKDVISDVADLTRGGFKEIIDDSTVKPDTVTRVLLCTGKIYYELEAKRNTLEAKTTAIVRFEQLYPIPKKQINALKKRYKNATSWYWVQEEPDNMGYLTHILRQVPELNLTPIARPEGASPATGSAKMHAITQEQLLNKAFEEATKKKGSST